VLVGEDLVRARQVVGQGQHLRATGLSIYDREDGALRQVIDAERARPANGAWSLENVRIYDSVMNLTLRQPRMTALEGVEPERLTLAKVDPDQLDFFTLKERIEQMERAGRPTEEARAGLWHKVSGPLSTLLMPLLAAVAAFGLARSGQVLLRATVGMALGFAYFVADNFSLAMGNVGAYPPLLAAWAPFVLFFLIGETVLIRSEE
jgi:lipopolysaccharide export system permease protein